MMRFHPFLSPDDEGGADSRQFSESEVQQLLSQRLSEEKQRFDAALQLESAARQQAENALRERDAQLRAHEMRIKAQEALRSRHLPDQLIGTLNLTSEETLAQTLSAAEGAFRSALEEGVRDRLRGHAPSAAPLPQKSRKPISLSYQEAAANYIRDRENH